MLKKTLTDWKYELLLGALILHLFMGVLLPDLSVYTKSIWIVNISLVGVASIGVFIEVGKWKKRIRNTLFILVLVLPTCSTFFSSFLAFEQAIYLAYVVFFLFIFLEVLKFLIKPGYVNSDIIAALACGYFLLIEMAVFLFQFCLLYNPESMHGVGHGHFTTTFTDLVYFCSITVTSIGFGDITPASHTTKLITSLLGIIGQFYTVVLFGILVSKFTAGSADAK